MDINEGLPGTRKGRKSVVGHFGWRFSRILQAVQLAAPDKRRVISNARAGAAAWVVSRMDDALVDGEGFGGVTTAKLAEGLMPA